MFHRFSIDVHACMERAADKARSLGHAFVEPAHLLSCLAEDGASSFNGVLMGLRVDRLGLASVALPPAREPGVASKDPCFSPFARQVLAFTVEEADRLGDEQIGTTHLLLGLLRQSEEVDRLPNAKLPLEEVRCVVKQSRSDPAPDVGDRIPARLFFELDERARASERKLGERLGQLEAQNRGLRTIVDLLCNRVAVLEQRSGREPAWGLA